MAIEKSRLAKKRDAYVHNINIYKRRREELRKRYGYIRGQKNNGEYNAKVKNLTKKIWQWGLYIRRINKQIESIVHLIDFINEYADVDLRNERPPKPFMWRNESEISGVILGYSLYYKYGVEKRLPIYGLRDYVGSKASHEPYRYRMGFTKSFKKNKTNKQTWENFKQQYEQSLRRA